MKKEGYTKRSWADFTGPWPTPQIIDGKKAPPEGAAQPVCSTAPGRHLGAPWMASRPIGMSQPSGADFGPWIEHNGKGLGPSFALNLEHSVPYTAGAVHPHTALLLFALAVNQHPDVIIETGTFYGYSTIYLAKACDLWDQGHVWTLDPEDKLIAQEVKDHPRISCIKKRSVEVLIDLAREVGQVDFAFIDSWKRLALWEFTQISPFVPEGGLVVFHDTQVFDSGKALYGMLPYLARQYDQMLFAGTPSDGDPHEYYGNADDRGLLVLRKREEDPFLMVADANSKRYNGYQVAPYMDYTSVALETEGDRTALVEVRPVEGDECEA